MHYLELGGAELSLIGLLNALDPAKVDVDLFIYSHQGPLMKYIPEWVNLLPEIGAYSVIERPMAEALKKGYFKVVCARILARLRNKKFLKSHPSGDTYSSLIQYVGDYVTPCLPEINSGVEYDLCISFLAPHNIGRDKVMAKKRLAWIHTDYSTVNIDINSELKAWQDYDYIASISAQVSNAFIGRFPTLKSKLVEIENILPSSYIVNRSKESDASNEIIGNPALLSIGRICNAKNYDNIPDIVRRIVDSGVDGVKWYIVGSGIDEPLVKAKIIESKMENHVILLGRKENPYPYIEACDIYVQPSRFEGKSVTVREAQILRKPVVITNYSTAKSQINNCDDGVIVPLDNEGCARGISDFIKDSALCERIVANLKAKDFANESEVNKIYKLLK